MLFCEYRFASKAGQKATDELSVTLCRRGSSKYSIKPTRPHNDMRPRNGRLKKRRPLIQTRATTKQGKKPIMAQLLVIPRPYATAARSNQDSRSSTRNSSRQRTT